MQHVRVRCYADINPVIDLVGLGETVTVHAGGFARPRRQRIGGDAALEVLEIRLGETGGQLLTVASNRGPIRRRLRGRNAVAMPRPDDGGDEAGVREPRIDRPPSSSMQARLQQPGHNA